MSKPRGREPQTVSDQDSAERRRAPRQPLGGVHPRVTRTSSASPWSTSIAPPSTGSRRKVQNEACAYFDDLDAALADDHRRRGADRQPRRRLHARQAIRCIEAGLTVMVEKPFGDQRSTKAAGVLERARAARQAGHRRRELPVLARPSARSSKLLQEEFLGALDNAIMVDRRHQPSHTEGPWFGQIDYPQLQEIAIHHFDSLRSLLRTPADRNHRQGLEPALDRLSARRQHRGTDRLRRHARAVPRHHAVASLRVLDLWIEGEKGVLWTNRKYRRLAVRRQPLVPADPQRQGAARVTSDNTRKAARRRC